MNTKYKKTSGVSAAHGGRHHANNPAGREERESFAELLEQGLRKKQHFIPFLQQLFEEHWEITPEQFRQTIINNVETRLRRDMAREGFKEENLPYAVQRYLSERKETKGSGLARAGDEPAFTYPDSHRHMSRMAVPSTQIIGHWFDDKARPDGTQLALFAYAFNLTPVQEHMMCKMMHGKSLSLLELVQCIKKGNSGAVASMLIHASGLTEARLAELIEVPDTTVHNWADRHHPRNTTNVEALGKFAKLMTQCLDIDDSEIKSWQVNAVQRDIMSLMAGRDLEKRPTSAKDAAARFQMIFEDAYENKQTLDQFLKRVMEEWDVPMSYFDFLNQNNQKKEKDYEPITERAIYDWVHGIEKPRPGRIEKIANGAFMSLEQELKLWSMVHGHRLSAAEVQADIAAGNSGVVLTKLIDASGLGRNRLLEATGTDTHTLDEWRDKDKPRPVYNKKQADALADHLLPLLEWDERPPAKEKLDALRKTFLECVTGRKSKLYDMVIDAVDKEKPHTKLFQAICHYMDKSNAELAEAFGISQPALEHYKTGNRICSEEDAAKFIKISGCEIDDEALLEATNILTCTRPPSEVLKLAEQGKEWIGQVYVEACKRRHIPRSYMQEKYGLSNYIMSNFEEEKKGKFLKPDAAEKVAEFIGFTGDERRRFVILASGQQLDPIENIIADAEALRCSPQEALQRMCKQTAMTLEKTADAIGLSSQQLSDYSEGKDPLLSFPKETLYKLGGLFGFENSSSGMKRLHKLYIPEASRIMEMVETQKMERGEGLKHLLALAEITTEYLIRECQLPEAVATDMDALLEDKRLASALPMIAEKLELNKTEAEVMDFIFNPERGHTKQNFAKHVKQYRDEILGGIIDEAVKQKQEWYELTHNSEPYLRILDQFAAQVPAAAQSSVKIVRDFLSGKSPSETGDSIWSVMAIDHSFRTVAQHIVSSTPPTKDMKKSEWRGEVFDAINKLLFQRTWACKERLGFPKLAEDAEEARQQKKRLLADAQGGLLLTAVIATNSGGIAQAAVGKLKDLPKYANNQELMMTDLWMGTESSDDDKAFVGGVIDSFPRWNPAGARYSTFAINMAKWRATHLFNLAKEEGMIDGHAVVSDVAQEHNGEDDGTSKIDDVSYQRFNHERRIERDRDDPQDVNDLLGKVHMALDMLPDTEKKLLTAIFEAFMDGRAPMLHELIPCGIARWRELGSWGGLLL
jgi:transcriptional regulator with XRE-family HTH domain